MQFILLHIHFIAVLTKLLRIIQSPNVKQFVMKNQLQNLTSILIFFFLAKAAVFGKAVYPIIFSNADTTQIFATICEGDEYEWNGTVYDQAGEYAAIFVGSDGLDSVVVLSIEELANDTTELNFMICSDESSPLTGTTFEFPFGEDSVIVFESLTLQNQAECDSLINAAITIYPVEYIYGWAMVPVGTVIGGIVYDTPGSYGGGWVECCTENGCNTYVGLEIYVVSATNEFVQAINLHIFPNPFEDIFLVNFELPESVVFSASLHDVTGKRINDLVIEENLQTGQHELKFEQARLPQGIYFLGLQFDEHVLMRKLVKK